MARRSRRHRSGFKIPVISTVILAGQIAFAYLQGSTNLVRVQKFAELYTGFNWSTQQFAPASLLAGYGPWLVKGLIMKVARPLGAAPRLPLTGLPISLT